ncbi:GPI transamidase component PIG-T [Schizophyllum amplum]|uniref:GPI transamidase component PIG-T n=1 Tax=Schizophyllum amplum TaxID=97359 RepID=A0A550CB67_9AGAR|nr:GPI transamidase component PIG-T [Auriculariopsis ampla]
MVNCRRCVAVALSLAAVAVAGAEAPQEAFEEDLLLKPLPDGMVLSKFTFRTLLRGAAPRDPSQPGLDGEPQHYTLFPLALGRIIREYAVDELHLSLNAGHWLYERWGLDARWSGVRNALAGLFCATLGTMDEWRTTSPALTFPPEGSLPAWNLTHHLRHATLPSDTRGKAHAQHWSLQKLFGRTIERPCPVASRSEIRVSLPVHEPYQINPEPAVVEDNFAIYKVAQGSDALNIDMKWPSAFDHALASNATHPLSIRRMLRGFSQDRGQLSVVIKNSLSSAVKVRYLETLPWFVQMYLHTMQVESDGNPRNDLVSDISYIPTIPHSRPTTFQATFTLPASSTTEITFDVTKAFLRYTEHPPDAQRGWDLPPAVLVPLDADPSILPPTRIYTPILLVDLATPDFSMPYNVIILSCSLIAFLFGSTFNLLTRKFVVIRLDRP